MEGQHGAELSPSKVDTALDNSSPLERPQEHRAMPDTRRRSSRIAASDANFDSASKSQTQKKSNSRPIATTEPLTSVVATKPAQHVIPDENVSDRFVKDIMIKLQGKMDKVTGYYLSQPADNAQKADPADMTHTLLTKGRDAVSSIYAAWSRYPKAGGTLDGATITPPDYRYTAYHVVKEEVADRENTIPFQIARAMATLIDPGEASDESTRDLSYEQKRINSCLLALKRQYTLWQSMLDPERQAMTLSQAHEEMIVNPSLPVTYTRAEGIRTLNPPSTPAQMLSSKGIAASAEDEAHDSVHIYVAGGNVLKTKQEKNVELTSRINEARAEEAKRAKDAQVLQKQATTPSRAAKARAGKTKTLPEADDEDEIFANVRIPLKNVSAPRRKRAAAAMQADRVNDAEGSQGAPTPTKRVKQMASQGKTTVSNNKDVTPASKGSGSGAPLDSDEDDSIAPDNSRPGGAAPKWLRDEDDLGKSLIMDNPSWPMPEIYRQFNEKLANTAYQASPKDPVEYRRDWVEHPRMNAEGKRITDKEARKYDICWRSFESIRQHLEPFKSSVNKGEIKKLVVSEALKPNLAVNLPSNPAPARYKKFRSGVDIDPAERVVPQNPAPPRYKYSGKHLGVDQSDSSSTLTEFTSTSTPEPAFQLPVTSRGTPTSTSDGRRSQTPSGWNPINKFVAPGFAHLEPPHIGHKLPSHKPKVPKAAAHPSLGRPSQQFTFTQPQTLYNPARLRSETPAVQENAAGQRKFAHDKTYNAQYPPAEQSAPGGELYDGLEDFVADQSDGEEEERGEASGTRTYTGAEVQGMLAGMLATQKKMEKRIEQLEASSSASSRATPAASEYDPSSPAFPPPQASGPLSPSARQPIAATDSDGVTRTDWAPRSIVVRLPVPSLYKGQ